MKLLGILAKALSEWPESAVCITQDDSSHLYGWIEMRPEFRGGAWYSPDGKDFGMHDPGEQEEIALASDQKKSIVTKTQWQAERDRQKGGEWKRHRGGKQPVADDVVVEYKLRNGYTDTWHARALSWSHAGGEGDVMKYRVISQPQAEEVAPVYLQIDMTETNKMFAKTEQVDGPMKWRDAVNELDAYIEEFTREREALINRLALEGFALIGKINANLDKIDAALDMSDWRNWKRGDVFENIGDYEYFTKGKQYTVNDLHDDCAPIKAIDDQGDTSPLMMDEVKFVRRP